MNLAQATKALAAAGTEQNRTVYRRAGATGEVFGVGFASLDALAKRIGVDHALARKLWKSGGADARLLATRVADARRITLAELRAWAKDLDWYVGADALAKLAFHTPHAKALALAWIESKREWIARAGWHTLALLTRNKRLADGFFEPFIARIETGIHSAPNRTRDAMNAALIAIGIRSAPFAVRALRSAKRIGKVEVARGARAIETPDAATYIRRARRWIERTAAARKPRAKSAGARTRVAKKTTRKPAKKRASRARS
jgi:3-methyladenine DNA glycosylase AlkD